jgi:hypothetical protein
MTLRIIALMRMTLRRMTLRRTTVSKMVLYRMTLRNKPQRITQNRMGKLLSAHSKLSTSLISVILQSVVHLKVVASCFIQILVEEDHSKTFFGTNF